jgi:hypothetical protein
MEDFSNQFQEDGIFKIPLQMAVGGILFENSFRL